MRYAITYIKVRELKSGELEFEGPIVGPVVPSREEADQRIRTIVLNSRNAAIMPKIYPVDDDFTIDGIVEMCAEHFERLKRSIIESKEITDKPIKRSK